MLYLSQQLTYGKHRLRHQRSSGSRLRSIMIGWQEQQQKTTTIVTAVKKITMMVARMLATTVEMAA